ncbi:hypothetical protein [Stenomitos frigidus]|uniref:Uncharacterized protein n=1 Tax=Stenomitos frigidus ULC18 TaxID=2107698 RepID=A0A2T1DUP2_9CYAN|nr:hypothetical protein [Stenomitos frigidus]PSB24094.1 hypothetical protein C7B82_28560 [Stenomitos frigidus ULC18]
MTRKDLLNLLAKKNASLPAGKRLNPFGKSDAAIAKFVGVQIPTAQAAHGADKKQKEARQAVFAAAHRLKAAGKPVTREALKAELAKDLSKKYAKKAVGLTATEGAVYAAGLAGGVVAGPVGAAVGGAATRAVIIGGQKIHAEMQKVKAESQTAKQAISENKAARRAIGNLASEGITQVKRVMGTLKSGEFLTELKHELGGDLVAPVLEEAAHHFIEHHAEHLVSAALGGGAAAVFGGMIVSKTVKTIDHALAHHKPLQAAGRAIAATVQANIHG